MEVVNLHKTRSDSGRLHFKLYGLQNIIMYIKQRQQCFSLNKTKCKLNERNNVKMNLESAQGRHSHFVAQLGKVYKKMG